MPRPTGARRVTARGIGMSSSFEPCESHLSVILDTGTRVIPLIMQASAPGVLDEPGLLNQPQELGSSSWIVTVYNNDHNTYDEVMTVLIVATGCTAREAFIETWEIDHLGKSVVHQSGENECLQIAEIISTIGIRVEVTEE